MRRALAAASVCLGLACVAAAAGAPNARVLERSFGGDRLTAIQIAQALLARPLAVQLTRVTCERYREQRFCGLVLSGVKFHRRMDTASFEAEVDELVRGAYAADPEIAEVDLWVTVPIETGKGEVVSGDFAQPAFATVYATTTERGDASPARGPNVFWDPTFRRELALGSTG